MKELFEVRYQDKVVGYLECDEEEDPEEPWLFKYNENEPDNLKVPGFPHFDKIYKSGNLWPFFIVRLPSMANPCVSNMISDEKLDITSNQEYKSEKRGDVKVDAQVNMMRIFGKRCISNPFSLHYMDGKYKKEKVETVEPIVEEDQEDDYVYGGRKRRKPKKR